MANDKAVGETCGTCGWFAKDRHADGSGACFNLCHQVSTGKWAYEMVRASRSACGSWIRYVIPIELCSAAERDGAGRCLGYSSSADDEPCEACKRCEHNTFYGME